jgi:nucleolar protein TMA23
MDTAAYLTRQGWRGHGHSLHPSGRGIAKPLLVSKKLNSLGIGKKTHDVAADQWWARAFDAGLKDLDIGGKDVEETVQVANPRALGATNASGMLKTPRENRFGNRGLYAGFVKGEGLSGTITQGDGAVQEPMELNVSAQTKSTEYGKSRRKKSKENAGTQANEDSSRQLSSRKVRKIKGASTTRKDHDKFKFSEPGPTNLSSSTIPGKYDQRRCSSASSEEGSEQVPDLQHIIGLSRDNSGSIHDLQSLLSSERTGLTTKKPRKRARKEARLKRRTDGADGMTP